MDTEDILLELKERMPALSAWSYIAIWAIAEMMQRKKADPANPHFEEIRFPHTNIPLFNPEEAKSLEAAWVSLDPCVEPTMAPQQQQQQQQTGGGLSFPPSLKDLSAGPKMIGNVAEATLNNPALFSIDKHFEGITSALDGIDEALTDFSKQYGVVALESVAPDPKFILPLGPIPIPVIIPARIILPVFNAILEVSRIASSLFPAMEFLGKPLSFLMVLLDLARGNLYHAIFSFFGLLGKYPMYAGIGLKILRDAYVMISPDIRDELRSVLYKSSKSMTVGFVIWLFTVVSPEIVRRPLVSLLDRVREMVDKFNDGMIKAEVKATAALKGFGSVEMPKIPSSRIPSIGDLYILQEYVHNPNIYCQPDVIALIKDMRAIPPLVLFFDLMDVPEPGSAKFAEACKAVEGKSLADQFQPKITMGAPVLPTTATTAATATPTLPTK
jgi:hypothetical protein